MKFISLFAGIGGFDLGMEQAGHECVAQVEWDKNAAGVLKRRWPEVPLFCDVTKVNAEDLPDADFITFGFPCQDLSVAGKREGLQGKRSGLFYESTRLIRGLLARGSGLRFALAENVAGLLSADDGIALAKCIRELLDCGAGEVGWRVLDSQYFGVAQRRRRVFIVSDFGGQSCDQILALTESLPRHPAPRRKTGQGSPSHAGTSAPASGRTEGADVYNATLTGDVAPTVTSATGISNASGPKVLGFKANQSAEAHGLGIQEEVSPTLEGGGGGNNKPTVIHPQGQQVMSMHETGQGFWKEADHAGCLRAEGENRPSRPSNVVAQEGEPIPLDMRQCMRDPDKKDETNRQSTGVGDHGDPSYPTTSAFVHGVAQSMIVRRLTSRECMRLQGFPDDHCVERCELELEGNEWKPTGKLLKQADGPIYKQAGNAVTVNVAKWIGLRLKETT